MTGSLTVVVDGADWIVADYEHSETTGRAYCRCGYWYDRDYWTSRAQGM